MKVVIVMTYLDRQYQLDKTLESFRQSKHNDFEVVVVDDHSEEEIELKQHYPFDVTCLRVQNKTWMNGVPAYNMGFTFALMRKADIIIIQNAECYHVGDVISYAVEKVTEKNYVVFGCYSLDKELTFKEHNIFDIISTCNVRARHDGGLGWYTHPTYRNAPYHFCSAISVKNLQKLNGFDERFSYGYAWEDVYFVDQVRNLGLQAYITKPPHPIVVHQYHYGEVMPDYIRYVSINAVLYQKLKTSGQYRAQHKITKDL